MEDNILKQLIDHSKQIMEASEMINDNPDIQFYSLRVGHSLDDKCSLVDKKGQIIYSDFLGNLIKYCVDNHIVPSLILQADEGGNKQQFIPEQYLPGAKIKKLPEYASLKDKRSHFKNESIIIIDSFDELVSIMDSLSATDNLLFRGINEAKFKQYSSSQRHWLLGHKIRTRLKQDTYKEFIESIIKKCICSRKLKKFIQKNITSTNEDNQMLILSLLQHYKTLSPLLDYSSNPYKSLFFAFDGCNTPSDEQIKENELNEYVAFYYLSYNKDLENCSINKLYEDAEQTADVILGNQLKDEGNLLNTQDIVDEFIKWPFAKFYDDNISYLAVDKGIFGLDNDSMKYLVGNFVVTNTSPRLSAQEGLFILNNSETMPLEDVMSHSIGEDVKMTCIHINKKLKNDVDTLLRGKNITRETVYYQPGSKKLEKIFNRLFPNKLLKCPPTNH